MEKSISFIHTSDWHLGRRLYGKQELFDDIFTQVEKLFEKINSLDPKPAFIVHSGDMFEKSELSNETRIKVYNLLEKLTIPLFVTRGNHEGTTYRDNEGRYCILDELDHIGLIRYLRNDYYEFNENVSIYGIGNHDESTEKKTKELLQKYPINKSKINIYITHTIFPKEYDEYQFIDQKWAEDSDFDYIAVGHIHSDKIRGKIFCPGSLYPFEYPDWPTKDNYAPINHKYFYHINISKIDTKSTISYEKIPLGLPRSFCYYYEKIGEIDFDPLETKIFEIIDKYGVKDGLLNIHLEGSLKSKSIADLDYQKINELSTDLLKFIHNFDLDDQIDIDPSLFVQDFNDRSVFSSVLVDHSFNGKLSNDSLYNIFQELREKASEKKTPNDHDIATFKKIFADLFTEVDQ